MDAIRKPCIDCRTDVIADLLIKNAKHVLLELAIQARALQQLAGRINQGWPRGAIGGPALLDQHRLECIQFIAKQHSAIRVSLELQYLVA